MSQRFGKREGARGWAAPCGVGHREGLRRAPRLGYRKSLAVRQNVNFRFVFAFQLSCLFFSLLSALESENRAWTTFVFNLLSALGNRSHFVHPPMPCQATFLRSRASDRGHESDPNNYHNPCRLFVKQKVVARGYKFWRETGFTTERTKATEKSPSACGGGNYTGGVC